jgi:hypothetical protein
MDQLNMSMKALCQAGGEGAASGGSTDHGRTTEGISDFKV